MGLCLDTRTAARCSIRTYLSVAGYASCCMTIDNKMGSLIAFLISFRVMSPGFVDAVPREQCNSIVTEPYYLTRTIQHPCTHYSPPYDLGFRKSR
jgi:hypothetical protein